jgi:hypothetical protein
MSLLKKIDWPVWTTVFLMVTVFAFFVTTVAGLFVLTRTVFKNLKGGAYLKKQSASPGAIMPEATNLGVTKPELEFYPTSRKLLDINDVELGLIKFSVVMMWLFILVAIIVGLYIKFF